MRTCIKSIGDLSDEEVLAAGQYCSLEDLLDPEDRHSNGADLLASPITNVTRLPVLLNDAPEFRRQFNKRLLELLEQGRALPT